MIIYDAQIIYIYNIHGYMMPMILSFLEQPCQFFYQTTMMATRVRSMLQACIYEKSLRLHDASANVAPVTLMQVDTGKVEDLTYSLHTLWDGIWFYCFRSNFLDLAAPNTFFFLSLFKYNPLFRKIKMNDPNLTSIFHHCATKDL